MYMILMGWGRRWGCACIDVYIYAYLYMYIFIYVYVYHDLTRIQYGFLTTYQVGYTSRKGSHLWCNCVWVAIWWWLQNCWMFNLFDGVDWSKGRMFLINDPIESTNVSIIRFEVWCVILLAFSCQLLSWFSSSSYHAQQTDQWSQVGWSCWPPQNNDTIFFLHQIAVRLPTWCVGHFFDLAKRCPNLPGWADECGGLA